jgi:hypothetical protein
VFPHGGNSDPTLPGERRKKSKVSWEQSAAGEGAKAALSAYEYF